MCLFHRFTEQRGGGKKNGQRTEKGERIDRKDRWREEEERKGKLLETFR